MLLLEVQQIKKIETKNNSRSAFFIAKKGRGGNKNFAPFPLSKFGHIYCS